MKVWVDILTPKQANFFGPLRDRLVRAGHEVQATTREYQQVNQLIALRGIEAKVVGRHGGADLAQKVLESARRVELLTKLMIEEKPDIAISFSSPEAARAAFGLGMPHFCVSDSPHAVAVSKLAVPISRKLFTPRIIPKQAWRRYGIQSKDIIRYNALDPAVWLRHFRPNGSILDSLGVQAGRPLVVVRPEEEQAAYLASQRDGGHTVVETIKHLLTRDFAEIVALARYGTQVERLASEFRGKIRLVENVIDSTSLLHYTSAFVGGGGTMSAEAALIGVPTISCFPGQPTLVDRYLMRRGLMERITEPERIARRVADLASDQQLRSIHAKRAHQLLESMEDPLEIIVERLERS